MKKQDISSKKNIILQSIKSGRLTTAFKCLREFSELQMTWEITDETARLEESYRYMLDYAMRGVTDPSRCQVYDNIVTRMLKLLDKLERHALTNESPTLYYNTLRYINQSVKESIGGMLRRYETLCHDYWSTGASLSPDCETSRNNRRQREQAERDLFNMLWTSMPLSDEDYEQLSGMYKSDRYYSHFKQFVTSGILLGQLEYNDTHRLMLLLDAYENGDDHVSSTAVVALMLSLYRYRDRDVDPKVKARLELLSDNTRWHNDLRDAFLELVRARDTERITRTMQEEFVPEMMKLKPEITKRFGNADSLDIDPETGSADINPEWQEMLEKSGIADKMRKMFEMQMEGGDVFMSAFAHLKSFPFFNEISNWFMPFSTERQEVQDIPSELSDMVRILESSPVFCNSDKYSFVFSMKELPTTQRDMLKSQLDAQINGLLEIQNSSTESGRQTRSSIMNRYVQDLYRFFRLFRRKGEFHDPFTTDLNLVTVPAISKEFNDIDSLTAIAEFYFKHKYHADALNLFKAIEELSCPDIQLFEKMGYCYEMEHDYEQALKYYEQAELLNAESMWTLRHIALCHRMSGRPSKALEYYNRIVDREQCESISTAMAIGNCYLETGEYAKAAKFYYKVNYLDEKKQRARRQLAWCLMMQREFEKATRLYEEIATDNATADDYLNMGHLALATANSNAINYYKRCIAKGDYTMETFSKKLVADSDAFRRMGLDPELIPLIVDAISYSTGS